MKNARPVKKIRTKAKASKSPRRTPTNSQEQPKELIKEQTQVSQQRSPRLSQRNSRKSMTDTLSIKQVHGMTKDLLGTLATVEKSLELATKMLTIFNKYNINASNLNTKEVSKLLTKLDPSHLDKLLQMLQSREISTLFQALNQASGDKTNE